jgi:hypothetical protein
MIKNNELGRVWEGHFVAIFRYYPKIFLEELRKAVSQLVTIFHACQCTIQMLNEA